MTRIVLPLAILTTTLALALPAQASLTRTFVSAAGSDSNPCTLTQPCATFAHAYSLTAASGIVTALDPGKYGPLTITTAITINGNGWAAITAPASGTGIAVNAGATDNVALIGIEIDGAGAGYNGIVFTSGGSLTVTNCVLQNFITPSSITFGNGILIEPASGTVNFAVTNTTASNNQSAGVYYLTTGSPNAIGTIDHLVAIANGYGIVVNTQAASGGTTVVTVSNSITNNNSFSGIYTRAISAPLKLSIDNLTAGGNGTGIQATNTPNVLLGRSVVTGNGTGVYNGTSPNSFYTYQDNRIDLNGTDIANLALNTALVLR